MKAKQDNEIGDSELDELAERLKKLSPPTKAEQKEQMVSFLMSDLKDYPKTEKEQEAKRAEIRKQLAERAW